MPNLDFYYHYVPACRSRPRRVTLICTLPHLDRDILATGRFRLVRRIRGGLRDKPWNRINVCYSEFARDRVEVGAPHDA